MEAVAPVIIEVNSQIKEVDGKRVEEVEPFKAMIASINEKYKPSLDPLNEMDGRLREKIVENIDSTESVLSPDGGKLVFTESLVPEVVDESKVDKKYLTTIVDMAKVKADMKKGIMNIKGIKVVPKYVVRVYTK